MTESLSSIRKELDDAARSDLERAVRSDMSTLSLAISATSRIAARAELTGVIRQRAARSMQILVRLESDLRMLEAKRLLLEAEPVLPFPAAGDQ